MKSNVRLVVVILLLTLFFAVVYSDGTSSGTSGDNGGSGSSDSNSSSTSSDSTPNSGSDNSSATDSGPASTPPSGSVDDGSFDPNSISHDTRVKWCEQQVASCPLICADQGPGNTAETNVCFVKTLQFQCICNNGFAPNASEYTQTIPYFKCTNEVESCKANCNGDSGCQDACNRPCGAKNTKHENNTSGDTAGGNVVDDNGDNSSQSQGANSSSTDVFSTATLTVGINGCFVIFLTVAIVFFAHV